MPKGDTSFGLEIFNLYLTASDASDQLCIRLIRQIFIKYFPTEFKIPLFSKVPESLNLKFKAEVFRGPILDDPTGIWWGDPKQLSRAWGSLGCRGI